MNANRGRTGVAYTLVAVMLLAVVASLFFAQHRESGHELHTAVAERVRSIDRFIASVETDSERAAYIAGFRTMIAMEQHVTSTGAYIANPDAMFRQVFLTGNSSSGSFVIMENSSFLGYIDRVSLEAAERGIAISLNVTNVTLWQIEPWSVLVNYTLVMNISDTRGTARWDVQKTLTGTVPITDIRDPLFSVGTLARVQRVITRTDVTTLVNDVNNANDTSGLLAHYNGSRYMAAGRGPTLLMRFAGNLSDSPYGIESLVDTLEIADQGLTVNTAVSIVDYEYFSGVAATVCSVQNTPSTMRFSNADLQPYQIAGKLTYGAC